MAAAIDFEKLKTGDRDAQSAFFEYVQTLLPTLRRAAIRYGCDYSDADDIVQDVIITLLTSIDRISSIDSERRLLSYIILVMRNKIIDMQRRTMRRGRILQDYSIAAAEPLDESVGEEIQLMHEAIATLPERDRLVIEQLMAGKKRAEIATALGCSVRTAEALIIGSMKKLRELLRQRGVLE
jgi:RNA polymerase sigma factor (sigma-70 family)